MMLSAIWVLAKREGFFVGMNMGVDPNLLTITMRRGDKTISRQLHISVIEVAKLDIVDHELMSMMKELRK